jgi:hypothetical protein
MRACVRACLPACVRACVRACPATQRRTHVFPLALPDRERIHAKEEMYVPLRSLRFVSPIQPLGARRNDRYRRSAVLRKTPGWGGGGGGARERA